MDHPNEEDFTYKIIFELLSKYPEIIEPYIKIEVKNINELRKKFVIVDGEWRLASE
ncbi:MULTISPECIES: hypothetical protein [Legionella]|uniref:Uncharacterized protein n=1 Tax=Legionella maceachernii TaxID=466 RepID=A0A0W0VX41_9GAMM|nr:hypothetical protein [Legionella maceachernii]KTD24868.1 hypothetical protein Lmac_2405 [Legionella maceachernii]SKA15666.1 hypothetical protein SAMN02745128_02312 [Legionella maceachernii]SUP01536.1 Uncharacterised protein [Legionella maceachernii]